MDLLTATDAADRLGISDSTLRKWARRGRISRETAPNGQPFYRREDVERLVGEEALWRAGTGADRAEAVTGGDDRSGPGQHGPATTGPDRADLSPNAARQKQVSEAVPENGAAEKHVSHHAVLIEHQAQEINFLRQQLQAREDARREEMERIDQERAEMRRLLLTSQQLAHELAQQLDQKALPPHTEPPAPKGKVRWWWFGRRS